MLPQIKNAYLFYGVAIFLFGYIAYMMIRRRKGDRPDSRDREPEL